MWKVFIATAIAAQGLVACAGESQQTPLFAGASPADAAVSSPRFDAATSSVSAVADAASVANADCFSAPKTHLELINACTDAEKVDKRPALPLLGLDGGLPPLP